MKNIKFESEVKRNEIKGAKLIWTNSKSDAEEYCFFRKTFMCDKLPKSAILNILHLKDQLLFIHKIFNIIYFFARLI